MEDEIRKIYELIKVQTEVIKNLNEKVDLLNKEIRLTRDIIDEKIDEHKKHTKKYFDIIFDNI